MLLPLISPDTFGKLLRRFGRNRQASAAVEFAFVAPVFFALLFAVIETALVFFAGQVLETAVQDSSRTFYTSTAITQANYTTGFCSRVNLLMDCNKVCIDVRTYAQGATIAPPNPYDSGGTFNNCTFDVQTPPAANSTVVVRAFYQWPLFVTGLGYNLSNVGGSSSSGKRLLAATNAVRPQ
jgi:Flp pilus assembly protein TadG